MKLHYEFEPSDIEAVKNVLLKYPATWRKNDNVDGPISTIDDATLWKKHIHCLLTTQQRSAQGSPIYSTLDSEPFLLSLDRCRTEKNLYDTVFQLLTDAKGIRRTDKIAKAVSKNLAILEKQEWDNLRNWRDKLLTNRQKSPDPLQRAGEEEAALYMDQFIEFGPKQSRNFWQLLGLTRYTFVLDSRVIKWLHHNLKLADGLLTTNGLSDINYYRFVSDMLFELCSEAGVLPCMFDAAIFDSFEPESS